MDKKARIGISVAVIATMLAIVLIVMSVVADVPVWSYEISLEEQIALEQQAGNAPGNAAKNAACQAAGETLTPKILQNTVQTKFYTGKCPVLPPPGAEDTDFANCLTKVVSQVRSTIKANCAALVIVDPQGTKCTITPLKMNTEVSAECIEVAYEHKWSCTNKQSQACGHVSRCGKDADVYEKDCILTKCANVPIEAFAACKKGCQKEADNAFKDCDGPA